MTRTRWALVILFLVSIWATLPHAQVTRYVYLTPVDGSGTDADPWHSRCLGMPGSGNIDLRPWGADRWLCASDTLPADMTGIVELGVAINARMSGLAKAALATTMGKAITADNVDEAIAELLISKIKAGQDGKQKIFLGGELPIYQKTAWVPFNDRGYVADVWNALQPAVAWATTLTTETFTGADGDLTGRTFVHAWTEIGDTGCTIVSNQVSIASDCNARADADLATQHMEVSVVMVSQSLGTATDVICGPFARKDNSTTQSFYFFFAKTSTGPTESLYTGVRVAGSPSTLATSATSHANGDTLLIRADGSQISGYQNGTLLIGPTTDTNVDGASYTRGGFRYSDTGGTGSCVFDTWNAADYSTPGGGQMRRRMS